MTAGDRPRGKSLNWISLVTQTYCRLKVRRPIHMNLEESMLFRWRFILGTLTEMMVLCKRPVPQKLILYSKRLELDLKAYTILFMGKPSSALR